MAVSGAARTENDRQVSDNGKPQPNPRTGRAGQDRRDAVPIGMGGSVLRQAILRKAFAGQLVAQDPNDEPAAILLEKIRLDREKAGRGAPTARRKRKAKLVE